MRDLRFVYGVLCGTVLTIAGVAIAQTSIETDAVKLSPQYYTVKLPNFFPGPAGEAASD
jgi:hypothetical protein